MIDQQSLRNAVNFMRQNVAGVQAATVASKDGLVMMSTIEDDDSSEIFTAMSSEVLGKGSQLTRELQYGDIWGTMVFGEKLGVIARVINEEMLLICQVSTAANVGEVVDSMNRLVDKLQVD